VTSLTTENSSTGRVGLGHAISPPRTDEAAGDGSATVHEQSHREGGRVPVGCGAGIERSGSGILIEVKKAAGRTLRRGNSGLNVSHAEQGQRVSFQPCAENGRERH
jgi:hypothetical protein